MQRRVNTEGARALYHIETLYRAVADPNPWPAWVQALGGALDCPMAVAKVIDAAGGISVMQTSGYPEWAPVEWQDYYKDKDPIPRRFLALPKGEVAELDEMFPNGELSRTEFYQDYWSRLPMGQSVHLHVGRGARHLLLCVSRAPDDQPLSGAELATLAQVGNCLEDVLEIRGLLERQAAISRFAVGAMENAAFGFALVSRLGRVEHMNATFRLLADESDQIHLYQGRLAASGPTATLDRLIDRALDAGIGGSMPVGAANPSRLLMVHVLPTPGGLDGTSDDNDLAAVIVVDPRREHGWSPELLQETFGLTPAEARVASMLASGRTSREIADILDIRTGSVRAHLKVIFAKTGVHSQVELVHMLLQASPLTLRTS